MASSAVYGYVNAFTPVGTPSICLELFGMDMMVTMMGMIQVCRYQNRDLKCTFSMQNLFSSIHQ